LRHIDRRYTVAVQAFARARREHALLVLATTVVAAVLVGYCVLAGPGAVESWQRDRVSDLGFVVVFGLLVVVLVCTGQWMATARRAVRARARDLARAERRYVAAIDRERHQP
jgi:hypothetical protein